jgi:hypothetical protein
MGIRMVDDKIFTKNLFQKISLCLILLVLIALPVYADVIPDEETGITQEDTLWNGIVELNLAKTNYSENAPITGTIRVHNQEDYPLVGQRIVLQIAQGEYGYPSQSNSNDNIILENTIDDIWVLPNSYKDIDFSLENPGGGEFRIDLYSWVEKSKFIGSSSILMAPISKEFSVEGKTRTQDAVIQRELTMFERVTGPVGFPVDAGEEFSGKVYVQNRSDKTKTGMRLGVAVCDWATVFCKNLDEQFFDVPSLESGKGVAVVVNLTAPDLPSAYAIQLTLYGGNNGKKIESIYKSRVIVTGGTSKARKIYLDGLDTKKYSLSVLYSGSPDHFTFPLFENFSIGAEIYNGGQLIEEEYVDVGSITSPDIFEQKFNINSTLFDYVCVKIKKDSIVYEQECFNVEIAEIQKAYDAKNPPVVQADWTYNDKKEELEFTISRDGEIDSRVFIITTDKTIYEKSFSGDGPFTEKIYLPKENYTMVIDDFIAKKQVQYDLFFNLATQLLDKEVIGDVPSEFKELSKCSGTICETGTVCAGASYESIEGACCPTSCIQTASIGEQILSVPLIVWIAIILVIVAIFMGRSALKKVRK